MNKKGLMWDTFADVFLAGIVLFVGLSLFFLITGIKEQNVNRVMEQKISKLNNDEVFVSYLNAKLKSGLTLSEEIQLAYINKEDRDLQNNLDLFLERVYSTKTCWTLYKNNEIWMQQNICRKEETLIDSTVAIPLPSKEILLTRLHVRGFST